MPDMCAGGHLTAVLQGPFEAWKVVVSVAASALWLLCGFIFRRGATCAYRENLRYQDIASGGAHGYRAVTSAAHFSRVRCGYLSAPLMGPVGHQSPSLSSSLSSNVLKAPSKSPFSTYSNTALIRASSNAALARTPALRAILKA